VLPALLFFTEVKPNITATIRSKVKGINVFFIIIEFISNIEQVFCNRPKFLPKQF